MNPSGPSPISRHRLFQAFFFAAFALTAWQLHRILANFYVALFGAGLLGLVVYPVHERILRKIKDRPNVAAFLTTALVVLVVVLPSLTAGWIAVKQASKLVPVASLWLSERGYEGGMPTAQLLPPRARDLWETASQLLRERGMDPKTWLMQGIEEVSGSITGLAKAALKNILFFLFQLGVLTFSLFFLLRDGAKVFRRAVELVPLPDEHKTSLVARLYTTVTAVLRGIFVVASVQGLLAAVGYFLFGVPFAVLLGAVTAFFAPIPILGTGVVWIPVTLGLVVSGSHQQAFAVALWSVLIVGTLDNLLRPILIGTEAKLPILLLFFGMLGGLQVYGFAGIVVGPVVVALFLALADIYRREYRWLLAPQKEEP